ncbi:MAG TPA: hypothetical protein PK907_10310 [Candidatus Sabulitectum sp.]|nr:hypothetical protein [Candidatus Sabulitectum sp.]HPR22840.1 hypothetical protein [Candidatus Sabulitectum sp.]
MTLENILESIWTRGLGTVSTPTTHRRTNLERAGLHVTDPERITDCPVLRAAGWPLRMLEGFRNGRYVSSALYHENDYELITVIEMVLPPFTCVLHRGNPRMVKSPVKLPLEPLSRMGNAVIVSDGAFLFSRKTYPGRRQGDMISRQLEEVTYLEELAAAL